MVAKIKIRITRHAAERFRQRIAPGETTEECRIFLEENKLDFFSVVQNPKDPDSLHIRYRIPPYKGFVLVLCRVSQSKYANQLWRVVTVLNLP